MTRRLICGARDGHVKTIVRTLQAAFKESGVANAHAHRFRHTLATEILIEGGTIEDCVNILGDCPDMIRKHQTVTRISAAHHRHYGPSSWHLYDTREF